MPKVYAAPSARPFRSGTWTEADDRKEGRRGVLFGCPPQSCTWGLPMAEILDSRCTQTGVRYFTHAAHETPSMPGLRESVSGALHFDCF